MASAAEYNSWADGLRKEGQIPAGLPLYFSEDMQPADMAKTALELYKSIISNAKPKPAKRMHFLTPYFQGGTMYYLDLFNNGEVMFYETIMPSGYNGWAIDDVGMETWGGRSKMGALLDRVEDGDFHRDLYRK